MQQDNRGVSTVLGYVLTVGISSLLIIGLLVATGGFVDTQRQETVRDEMEVLAQQLAGDLSAADRMVAVGGSDVTIRRELPSEITGNTYQVSVQSTGGTTDIILTTNNPDVQVSVTVRTRTTVGDSTVTGGPLVITYDGTELGVERA